MRSTNGVSVEELSAFLLLVSQNEFVVEDALAKSRAILQLEPTNLIVRRYEQLLLRLRSDGVAVFHSNVGDDDSLSEDASSLDDFSTISESSESTLSPSDSDS